MDLGFNKAGPPHFRGLDPDLPIRVYYRHLPHWRQEGASYFVTFRLNDSLPKEKQDFLKRLRTEWERTHPEPRSEADWKEHAQDIIRRTEAWLDEGAGKCFFRDEAHANGLIESLHHFQNERYFLSCWTVMPNHCHAVLRPHAGFELEDLLKSIKGVSARKVNQATDGSGSIWQEESYDRIIRDEEHLWRVIQYIGRNPLVANIPKPQWRRWIHPDWVAVGWNFFDDEEQEKPANKP